MQYTLLEMIQLILSALDSDEVNSYDDTIESMQVANILRSLFFDIATELDLPELDSLFELNASGDNLKPVLMTVPSNVKTMEGIKYNYKLAADSSPLYTNIQRLDVEEFLNRTQTLNADDSNVGVMSFSDNGETFETMYTTDAMPTVYCQLGTTTLIFDSHDATEDTTLQKSKTMCKGILYPTFTMSNSFVPPLNASQFGYYINRAKERAFGELKQVTNAEASREAKIQRAAVQRLKDRVDPVSGVFKAPRYGRTR